MSISSIGTVAASGSRSVSPTVTTVYTLTATNAAGSATLDATVTVGAAGSSGPIIVFNPGNSHLHHESRPDAGCVRLVEPDGQ